MSPRIHIINSRRACRTSKEGQEAAFCCSRRSPHSNDATSTAKTNPKVKVKRHQNIQEVIELLQNLNLTLEQNGVKDQERRRISGNLSSNSSSSGKGIQKPLSSHRERCSRTTLSTRTDDETICSPLSSRTQQEIAKKTGKKVRVSPPPVCVRRQNFIKHRSSLFPVENKETNDNESRQDELCSAARDNNTQSRQGSPNCDQEYTRTITRDTSSASSFDHVSRSSSSMTRCASGQDCHARLYNRSQMKQAEGKERRRAIAKKNLEKRWIPHSRDYGMISKSRAGDMYDRGMTYLREKQIRLNKKRGSGHQHTPSSLSSNSHRNSTCTSVYPTKPRAKARSSTTCGKGALISSSTKDNNDTRKKSQSNDRADAFRPLQVKQSKIAKERRSANAPASSFYAIMEPDFNTLDQVQDRSISSLQVERTELEESRECSIHDDHMTLNNTKQEQEFLHLGMNNFVHDLTFHLQIQIKKGRIEIASSCETSCSKDGYCLLYRRDGDPKVKACNNERPHDLEPFRRIIFYDRKNDVSATKSNQDERLYELSSPIVSCNQEVNSMGRSNTSAHGDKSDGSTEPVNNVMVLSLDDSDRIPTYSCSTWGWQLITNIIEEWLAFVDTGCVQF